MFSLLSFFSKKANPASTADLCLNAMQKNVETPSNDLKPTWPHPYPSFFNILIL